MKVKWFKRNKKNDTILPTKKDDTISQCTSFYQTMYLVHKSQLDIRERGRYF